MSSKILGNIWNEFNKLEKGLSMRKIERDGEREGGRGWEWIKTKIKVYSKSQDIYFPAEKTTLSFFLNTH